MRAGDIDLATIISSPLGLLRGNPQMWASHQKMATLLVSFSLLGALFFEQVLDRERIRWIHGSLVASKTAGLGGMEPRGLGDGHDLMISHRSVALFGAVVVSMASL
jgi:hypothetical protein